MFNLIMETVHTGAGNTSRHFAMDRQARKSVVESLIKSEHGYVVKSYIVDTGHKNGLEVHDVYSNSVVKIYNYNTNKHITDIIARPNQIKRYDIRDAKMLEAARIHKKMNLNK